MDLLCDSGVSVRVRPDESMSARRSLSSREGFVRACDVDGLASNARARRSQNARRTSPRFSAQDFSAALVGRVSKFGTVFPRSAVRVNLHRPELANSLKKSVKSECERALGKISKFSRDVEKRVQVFIQLANGLPDIPPRTGEIVAAFARKDIGSGVSEVIARHPTVD